jgi:hypothetical protein
VNNSDYRYKR